MKIGAIMMYPDLFAYIHNACEEATGRFELPNRGFADPRLNLLATSPKEPKRTGDNLPWSGRWGSNPRPSPWQGDVLPLNYFRIWCRGGDSNSYRLSPTTPSRWRVYQFHHLGLWQGRKDSNPRPAVLETAALPAELHPYYLSCRCLS